MSGYTVTVFRPYPFRQGQKIRIEGSRRKGDWEVVGIEEDKVTLRCPVSNRQFTWERFCSVVEEKENSSWPMEE